MRRPSTRFHQSVFTYEQGRWFWFSLLLGIICSVIFLLPVQDQPRNGGTWQGYTLGTVGALLIFWLAWLGIRKRQYARTRSLYQGWVSAHIYLGGMLLLIATLHTAFQFGNNVHTLSYVLMVLVIVSGIFGAWSYFVVPERLARLRNNQSQEDLLKTVSDLDRQCLRMAEDIHPDVGKVVKSTIKRTALGGSVWRQISGRDDSRIEIRGGNNNSTAQRLVSNRNQLRIIELLSSRVALSPGGQESVRLQELLWLFAKRKSVLRTLRMDIRLQSWMQIWLMVHVPLSIALLIALAIHIFSVFFYW